MANNTVIPNKPLASKPIKNEVAPPQSPPLPNTDECVDGESGEKIYISMVAGARETEKGVVDPFERKTACIEREKRERDQDIYKFNNSVIKPQQLKKHRGSYRTNAIQNRCRQFAQDFYNQGFNIGCQVTWRELRYRMITLNLCHDKVTVKQYFERLVMYGYFKILKGGQYEFRSLLPVGQQALPDLETTLNRLNASLNPLKRKRRSF